MKTLKLVGLQTFISPFTKLKPIRNGETVTVEDDLAEHLLQGHENTRDRGRIDHWMVVSAIPSTVQAVVAASAQPEATSEEESAKNEGVPVTPAPADPASEVPKAAPKSQRVARKQAK